MAMQRAGRLASAASGGLLLGFLLLAAPARAQEAGSGELARFLPADAVALVSLPDLTATLADCRSLPLWRMAEEKAVAEFLAKPLQQMRDRIEAERKRAVSDAGFDPGTVLETKFRGVEIGLARLRFAEAGGPPDVGVAIRVDAGADFPRMKALLDALRGKIPPGKAEVKEVAAGGKTYTVLRPPAGEVAPSAALFWAAEGTSIYLAVGTPGSEFAEEFLGRVTGTTASPPLAADADFRACAGRVGNAGSEFRCFLRVPPLLAFGLKALAMAPAEEMPPFLHPSGVKAALDALGLTGLRAIAFASTAEGEHSVNESYLLAPAPRKGLLALASEAPVDRALLARVPADAASFSTGGLRVGEAWDALLSALRAVAPDTEKKVSAEIARFEQANGVDLRKDLLGSIGEQYVSYSMPMKNVMMGAGPDVTFIVPLRDAAAFERAARVVADAIVGTGVATQKEAEVEGTKIRSFSIKWMGDAQGFAMMSPLAQITPAYAVKGNTLVVSLSRQSLQRAVRRVGQPAGEGGAANEGFRRFAAKVPAGASSIGYSDARPTVGAFYSMITGILPLAASGANLPIDLELLPPAEALTKHLFGSVSYSKSEAEGCYACSYSPWGIDTVLGLGVVGAAAAASFSSAQAAPGKGSEVVEPPKGTADPVERARRDLLDLKSGLTVYKIDHESFPAALADLLARSAEYPDGLLQGRKEIPKDPWGNPYLYERGEDGKSYRLRSAGANGKDEGGQGDDVVGK